MAHTLRLPSESPAARSPSPRLAPRRSLPALPASLPTRSGSAPTDSPAGSVPHNSATVLHTPGLLPPVSCASAPQTVHECRYARHTPTPSHSTPPATAAVPPP